MTAIRLTHLHSLGHPAEHPVAWHDDRLVDWQEYHGRVAALSREIATRAEQRWLLACTNALDFAIGLFALWHAGKVAVIPPSLRPGALADLARHTEATLDAVIGRQLTQDLSPLPALDPTRTRIELFTSGSSGEAKAVGKTLAQLDNEVQVLEQVWGRRAATTLTTVPHHHIYGLLFQVLWPLAGGRPFDTRPCGTPEQLLARLDRIGPGIVISSPSQLTRMPELIDPGLLRGRAGTVFSSGGPLPAATASIFRQALGEAPLEIYGSTETGGIAWRQQTAHDDAWTLQPGVAVHLADDGALTLTSPFLPDDQPVRTGDAGQWLDDGRFRLLGRIDRVVKIEEKRLSLAEMEARLATHPWVSSSALVALSGRRQSVGAILVLSEDGQQHLAGQGRGAITRQLRLHLGHWYDAILLPRHWRFCATLPYNERGKLAQADLLALFADRPHA